MTISGQNLSCGLNETINECGTICEPDCKTIFTRKQCDVCGTPACSCIQGYARQDGNCVYWGDCPLEGLHIWHSASRAAYFANLLRYNHPCNYDCDKFQNSNWGGCESDSSTRCIPQSTR